jgi:hypothetical protein
MLQCKSFASVAFVLALAASPAMAADDQHDQHHPAAGMPSGMPGGMMRMMGMGSMQMMAEHVEGRIAFLKAELKITDAQLPQWNALADAMRHNAHMMGPMMGMGQDGSLPDKLAAREKQLDGQLDAIRKLKAAVDPLYAALSADQKKTADEIMISPMGMMM